MNHVEETVEREDGAGRRLTFSIQGRMEAGFAPVLRAFMDNFVDAEGIGEVGASVSLWRDGRPVVDLWGGYRDAYCSVPWAEDTLVCTMSNGKALAGVAMNMLIDRGQVDPDAPVAVYWPEFGQAGKEGVLVRHTLDHRAGLPYVDDPLWRGAAFHWDAMVDALARQAPLWEPGAQAGYHALTMGFLVGEVMRRVTGVSLSHFIRKEISTPLGIDFHVGLTDAEVGRCADFVGSTQGSVFEAKLAPSPHLVRSTDQLPQVEYFNSVAWRKADLAAANSHGNARSIARFYAALANGGELDGVRLMSQAAVDRMRTEQHHLTEIVALRDYHQGLGILLNTAPWAHYGPNPRNFGSHGFGGAMGFADPDRNLGFSYAMNVGHRRLDSGPRAVSLWKAAYGCL